MALLDDINAAKAEITARTGRLFNQGGRLQRNQTWQDRWLGADNERLTQLDLLSQAVQDPRWTARLDDEVQKRKDAGFAQADAGLRRGEDQRKVAAAGSGTAAGSWDAVVQQSNEQDMARIKATVTQQVDELRRAGIQNLEDMGRQLLEQAIAGPEETGAMGVGAAQDADRANTGRIGTQIGDQARGLLANTISSFLSGTVTPAVTMGFQSADRWNSQMRNNYADARDAGAYRGNFADWEAANGGSRSWWGI